MDTIRQNREVLKRELEAAGAKFRAGSAICCPFHDDKRPSAGIYQGKDGAFRFKCQASECGFCGDIFDVRARATSRPLAEVLFEAIGQVEDRPAKDRSRQSQAAGRQGKIYADLNLLRAALPGRVISEHPYKSEVGQIEMIIFRCQVDEDKSYRPAYPVKGGFRLAAPPKPWPLYQRDVIMSNDTLIICEGEKCCDVLAQYDMAATTNAFGSGKAEHADWTLLAGKNIVVWPDNDLPGQNHMRKICGILETTDPKPRIAWLEPGDLDLGEREDVADFVEQLQTLGRTEAEISTELHRVIAKAKPLGPLDKLHRRVDAIMTGAYRLVHWPWPVLTSLTAALLPGTVTLLAGTVGASKSFMLMQCIICWLNENESVSYFCLEGDRPFHLSRALSQLAECAGFTDVDWVKENPLIIRPAIVEHSQELERLSRHLWTSDDLSIELLEQLGDWIDGQAKLGRRVVAVDPVTMLARSGKPWVSDLAFVKAAKRTAKDYGCSILLITHPTKDTLEPTLQNLAGGSAYQRFVDVVITLQNHEPKQSIVSTPVGTADMEHNRTVRVEKARNGRGTGCRLAFDFEPGCLKLKELGVITKKKGEDE
ncbi:hypothetical protein ES703_28935 [subsurface metagenome]